MPTMQKPPVLKLGVDGFDYPDLHHPRGLRRLAERFDAQLAQDDPALFAAFEAYRQAGGEGLTPPAKSELLVRVAEHLSRFVARLFGIGDEAAELARRLTGELPLFEFKKEFVSRRVYKRNATDRPAAAEFPALESRMRLLLELGFPGAAAAADPERALAEAILSLLQIERCFADDQPDTPAGEAQGQALRARWASLRRSLLSTPAGREALGSTLVGAGSDGDELRAVRGLLALADRWSFARALHPQGAQAIKGWTTHRMPQPIDHGRLVSTIHPDPSLPEAHEGPVAHRRRRDGFKLTDRRMGTRQVMDETSYCLYCHQREKDSCSTGLPSRAPASEGTFRKNPLGIPLTGCPLDEKISEAHLLKARGDSLGSLAMIMVDNPMCPGTGHRICNDCMKACVFQKQDPVNIPQIETSALTDVLALPWGFEIYGLFTRWNPLRIERPYPLPYLGKNVLVVGLGPAGYTLAQYLLNEGFAVVGIDGLKIEPLSRALTPIRDFYSELAPELDERVLGGFGGVSEYGITVRWDKSFLTLMHLTLARREGLRLYGGVRFGGTLTLEDAWELGFDHVAIATGAGKPTLVGIKNNLIRGVRKASDFLMALQLTGAAKRDSLASLQVQLPALVVGGGLTAIDAATELLAYYPVQVEKVLLRHETLCAERGEPEVRARLDAEELAILGRFLEHGRAIRAERARAAACGEAPDFAPLLRAWGGVAVCYRRTLAEAPAYRLSHEEIIKGFEEGIRFIERMSPVEAVPDEHGAVRSMKFERMKVESGKLLGTGELVELPARFVCVAAGTSPNVTYEREHPGTFELDARGYFLKGHELREAPGGGFSLAAVPAHEDLGRKTGFFTSYEKGGRFVSFYGDNHPTYAGNVVKAMASARDGYPEVARLFARELGRLDLSDEGAQQVRDARRAALFQALDRGLSATVAAVNRLTPTIIEVVVHAPFAARRFRPGQFYRLQNYESQAKVVDGTRLAMEGLALTGAWVDRDKGLLSVIVLEMGSSSRLCAALVPGEKV
ncbi:MAG: FAD-dependent oxidoreductase, partial [Myxococcaceae bacterium]